MKIKIFVAAAMSSCILLACSIANAQTVDLFEFGQYSGFAVRSATWLDYFNQKCNGESTTIYINQTNFILKEIGGRSADSVRKGAAKASGMTPEKIRQFALNEVDAKLSELGGCKSKNMKDWIEEALFNHGAFNKYLLDVANLMRQNPGRNIFR